MSEVQWTQVVAALADDFKIIYFYFTQLTELTDNAEAAEAWTNGVDINSLRLALFSIHQAMMGKMLLLHGPIIKLLANKLYPLNFDALTQSKKWLAVNYLDELIGVQAEGYAVLLNVYKAKGMAVQPLEVQMKERFSQQLQVSTSFINPLYYVFWNVGWGHEYFVLKYVDTHEVVASEGMVVVGLQLYAKQNRIGIQIAQATPQFTEMEENVSPPAEWVPSPGWGPNYFRLDYTDTNINMLPPGMVITGAALYQKGNRMALKIRGTPIDVKTGKFTGPPVWQGVTPDNDRNYFKTKYCDSHQVLPSALSCLNGAGIYQKNNRIGIQIFTINLRAQTA